MKSLKYIVIFAAALTLSSCGDSFLEESPAGELTNQQAAEDANIEGVIISAYAVLDGQYDESSSALNSGCSNWQFGDVVSDDFYKGGGGTGDQNQIHLMEIFQADPTCKDFERKWSALYEGVTRCNQAIRLLQNSSYSKKDERIAEMKFLRGHYYFTLKIIYNQIQWIDETRTDVNEYNTISNTEYTSDQLWEKILDDFKAAYDGLPDTQSDPGRPTKMAARAYMAKVYLFTEQWQNCAEACDEVINSNKYALLPNFRDVFLPEDNNSSESIFAVQCAINDGSTNNYNGNPGDRLLPPGGPYPSYGFMRPTQNLVNAYKTDANGLPVEDNVDVTDVDNVDVRLDHTIARPGLPWMDMQVYDWTPREESVYGPYSPKKRLVSMNNAGYLSSWPYTTSLNFYIIRYADLLLWRAESAIELGDLSTGVKYINMVRERAATSKPVEWEDIPADTRPSGATGAVANYKVGLYTSFANKEEATQALRTERRLEMAMEGERFFDLVRWGIADEVINTYIDHEKTFRSHLTNAHFTKGKNEYFPIPQSVIDQCGTDVITQNPGYGN